MGLERGPPSLVMIIEELFQGNSGPGLETEIKDCGGIVALTTRLKLALTSPTIGGRSVGRYSSLADSSHGVFSLVAFI
jgi:hypothetical protein